MSLFYGGNEGYGSAECESWPIVWPCDPAETAAGLLVDDGEGNLVPVDVVDVREMAESVARSMLWGLTGRRLGLCETHDEYRVGYQECPAGRRGVEAILLGRQPVFSVDEVTLFGVTLDPGSWSLERGGWLRRVGGVWPIVAESSSAPIGVRYVFGVPVGEGAPLHHAVAAAMGEVACEVLRALGGADCRLPSNAVSVTRNGVTIDLGDAESLWSSGRSGLPLTDHLIRVTNPHTLTAGPLIVSPDLPRRVR